jgi:hypothetical protein
MVSLVHRASLILNSGGYMTHTVENNELVKMLTDARCSARLQLLELLDNKLERLKADGANADQIILTLKRWISVRQPDGGTVK